MVIKNCLKKAFVVLLAVILIFVSMGFTNEVEAKVTKVPQPSIVYSATTSENYKGEYYTVKTPKNEPNAIYVYGKTKLKIKRFAIRVYNRKTKTYYINTFVTPTKNGEFYVKIDTKANNKNVPKILNKKGTVVGKTGTYSTRPGYKAVPKMPKGTYQITITRAFTDKEANVSKNVKWWKGPLGGNGQGAFATPGFTLVTTKKQNELKLVKYKTVINGNSKVRSSLEKNSTTAPEYKGSYVRYRDTYMKDMDFLFVNPKTKEESPLTAAKVKYIKNLTESVTKGAKTKYAKLEKIYEFLSKTFYYDLYAYSYLNQKGINRQYVNPYTNLYNSQHKIKSENSVNKKVATTCQGYSGMFIAMARAVGVPARFAMGHHVTQPGKIWANETDKSVQKTGHWWAEAYVNGKWITVDSDAGSTNLWKRKSLSDKGTWIKGKAINYTAFDPSPSYLSNSHSMNEIRKGSNLGKYLNNAIEVSNLRKFLNTTDSTGTSNGKKMNAKYSSKDFSTWGYGSDRFLTDGFGRIFKIKWQEKHLTGNLNLSNFTKLKWLTVNTNGLTGLNLKSCTALEYASIGYNDLTSFDSSTCKKLTTINAKGNEFTDAKFLDSGKLITIQSSVDKGNFAFSYNKSNSTRLSITVGKAPEGYIYKGIYKGSTCVTTSTDYSFNPTAGTYTVMFEKLQ